MDETQTRWFRWIAHNAKYLFWGIWGGGVGTYAAIFFKAVDAGGDVLRVYLAILTAMMGGALALATSRGMDLVVDSRKRRRRIYSNLVLIRTLRWEYTSLMETVIALEQSGRTADASGNNLTDEDATPLLVCADRIVSAAEVLPDFDELVENDADVDMAALCRNRFNFSKSFFGTGPEGSMDVAATRRRADKIFYGNPARKGVKTLDHLDKYWTNLLRS